MINLKNPNGYGSVVKLSGTRREPYLAKKTIGVKANGQPIAFPLKCFSSQPEANIFLAEYNVSPVITPRFLHGILLARTTPFLKDSSPPITAYLFLISTLLPLCNILTAVHDKKALLQSICKIILVMSW